MLGLRCLCDKQIENEYGSYQSVDCGHDYMAHLHDLARHHLGNDTVLFTTDGSSLSWLQCGATNDTYATVDFGPTAGQLASSTCTDWLSVFLYIMTACMLI